MALRWVRSVENSGANHVDDNDTHYPTYDARIQECTSIPFESVKIVVCEVVRDSACVGPDSGPVLLHVQPLRSCNEGDHVVNLYM